MNEHCCRFTIALFKRKWLACVLLTMPCFAAVVTGNEPDKAIQPDHKVKESTDAIGVFVDDACRDCRSDDSNLRMAGIRLVIAMARCPAYHRELVRRLGSGDESEMKFVLLALEFGADLDDIPAMAKCVRRFRNSENVRQEAGSAAAGLLGVGPDTALKRLQEFGSTNPKTFGKTYSSYWTDRLNDAVRDFNNEHGSYERSEGLSQALYGFLNSPDERAAASALVALIRKANPKDSLDRTYLPWFLYGIQLYSGPLYPHDPRDEKNDADKIGKTRQLALDWWDKNNHKAPVSWRLASLSRQGFTTSDPVNAESTASGLISALKSDDKLVRYTAGMVLRAALPGGESLIVERDPLKDPRKIARQVEKLGQPAGDYLNELLICRANHWILFEAAQYRWNGTANRYERAK